MNTADIAKKRYSTKNFRTDKATSPEQMQGIKDLLRFSPSSVNGQPWHFICASTENGKARIAKAVQGFYSFNLDKVLKANHVIVFCARTTMDDSYLDHLLDQETKDGRFADDKAREGQKNGRKTFVNLHKTERNDLTEWTARQTYLNLGVFLLGVAGLGLDAVPIEGFDTEMLDSEFGLAGQGLRSLVLVAVGYRAEDDFNAALPKSRLPENEIITEI